MTEAHVDDTDSQPPPGDAYRRRIYDALLEDGAPFEQRVESALAIACEYLDVTDGSLNRVDQERDEQEVVAAAGSGQLLPGGARIDHSTAYCSRVREADDPVAISDAPGEGLSDAPDYRTHGLACYLGAPVYLDGAFYGTVCFVSQEARTPSFGSEERTFAELVAGLIGRELEARQYERELEAREQRLAERERELDRSTRKYRSVVEAAPDAIFLVDAETGEIVEANREAATLTGRDEATLSGLDLMEIHPPEYHSAYREALATFADERTGAARLDDGTPLVVRRPDGTDVPIEVSATTVQLEDRRYVQAIMRDISDRHERERELRVKNRAIEAASVGVTIADATGEDNPIIYANEAFESLTGYSEAEILGRNCRTLQGPDTDPGAVATLRQGLEEDTPVKQELLNVTADGTPFWNEVTITPVRDDRGAVTHYVGFQRDVTERKRRERLVSVLNRVLRHNLRNDMTVVGGYAQLLAEETEGTHSELAGRIAETAADLTEASEKARLLEDAAHEEPATEPLDLVPVVERVAERARSLDENATVTVEVPEGATALGTERVERAIEELVENAVEHAGAAPTVAVTVESDAEGVTVRVADDGPGLSEMERDVLASGNETQLSHGQGVGLWLVRWLVSQAGGSITAVDTEDGATIEVRLRSPDAEGDTTRPSALGLR
jgi:PAS domain S-box-containing protein